MKKFNLSGVPILIIGEVIGLLSGVSDFSKAVSAILVVIGLNLLYKNNKGYFGKSRLMQIFSLAIMVGGVFIGLIDTIWTNYALLMFFVAIVAAAGGALTLLTKYYYIKGFIDIANQAREDYIANKLNENLKFYIIFQIIGTVFGVILNILRVLIIDMQIPKTEGIAVVSLITTGVLMIAGYAAMINIIIVLTRIARLHKTLNNKEVYSSTNYSSHRDASANEKYDNSVASKNREEIYKQFEG